MYALFTWSHNFVRILWQTQCAPVPLGHTSTFLFEILLNERSWLYSFQKHFCGYTQWKHLFNTFTDIWTSAWYTGKTTLISNITSFGSSSPCVKFMSVCFYSTLRSSHGHTLIVWQVTTWIFLLLMCQISFYRWPSKFSSAWVTHYNGAAQRRRRTASFSSRWYKFTHRHTNILQHGEKQSTHGHICSFYFKGEMCAFIIGRHRRLFLLI